MKIFYSLFLFFVCLAGNYANLLSIDVDLYSPAYSKTHGVPSTRISLLVQKSNSFRLDPNLPVLACGLLKDLFPKTDLANCLSHETDSSSSASSSFFTNELLHLGKGALIDPRSILRNGVIIDGSSRNSNQTNKMKQPQWGNGQLKEDSSFWVYAWSIENAISDKNRKAFRDKLRNLDVTYLPGSEKLDNGDESDQSFFLSLSQQVNHHLVDEPDSLNTPNWKITAIIKPSSLLSSSSSPSSQANKVETRVCRDVANQGFKRSLRYSADVQIRVNQLNVEKAYFAETTQCSIALIQRIPAETFIDLDEIRRNGAIENCVSFFPPPPPSTRRDPEHFSFCGFTRSIDVERPFYSPLTTQHLLVMSRELQAADDNNDPLLSLSEEGIVSLKATFGLHFQLRYQEPGCNKSKISQADDVDDVDDAILNDQPNRRFFKDGSFLLLNESGMGSGGCYRKALFPRPSIHLSCRRHQRSIKGGNENSSLSLSSRRNQAILAILYAALGGEALNDNQWVSFPHSSSVDDNDHSSCDSPCGVLPFVLFVPVGSTDDAFIVSAVTAGVTTFCAMLIVLSAAVASVKTKTKSA